MSHFYGITQGSRGEATRCGSKANGLKTIAAAWTGAIKTTLYVNEAGKDCYRVEQIAWKGAGVSRVIAEGEVGI